MKPVAVVSCYSCRGNPSSDFKNTILNDSKQLSEKERNYVYYRATSHHLAVTHLEPLEIDSINILNASIKAMQECVLKHPNPNIS
jgi:ribonuclease HII